MANYILPIAKTIYRGTEKPFGIKLDDRRRHMYILGKTGTGKTTLLERMAIFDIRHGAGLAYIDPHGESVERLLHFIPKERIEDTIYFNPKDLENPIAFNPLENISWERRHLIAYGLLSVFKKIWAEMWSTRMEYILTNVILALLEWPGSTLLDINRMLGDDQFRKKVVSNLKDVVVRSFWEKEFARYHQNFRTEAIAPIQNKIGQFITNPLIRNIIGQIKSSFNLRQCMDEGKIILNNLSKGAIGEESSMLLGGLLISAFQAAALSRIDVPEDLRKDFFLYIDEFQSFSTESFINILSEARKFRLNLILAHQYLNQIPESIRQSIFGNVGTQIIFRVGPQDAEILTREFDGLNIEDFTNLPNFHAYIKLLVDGYVTPPFLAITYPPYEMPSVSYAQEVIQFSRIHYTEKRAIVEARIAKLFKEIEEAKGEEKIITCQICQNPFWSKDEEICPKCKEKETHFISLKALEEKGLVTEFKKEKISKSPDLDEILKFLE
jgi:hypothetical protein